MDQSAEQCRFVEAEQARLKIEELKKEINEGRKSELSQKHQEEQTLINKSYEQELEEFKTFWEQKLEEYKYYGDLLQKEMEEKH